MPIVWMLVTLFAASGCGRIGFASAPVAGGDAGADATVGAACAGPEVIFCDGFEDPTFAAWTWKTAGANLITNPAFRGATALHVRAGNGMRELVSAQVLPDVFSGRVHARAYIQASAAADDGASIAMIGERHDPWDHVALSLRADGTGLLVTSATDVAVTPTSLPRDRWVCVELAVEIDDVAGWSRMWLDGTLAASIDGIDTRPAMPYDRVNYGAAWTSPLQPVIDVYVDEVVVSYAPIGCE